uniref:DNA helicase n=1 Tax=Quercus lobata TaxID=97700 RepID=A0A7N2KY45_QUELO
MVEASMLREASIDVKQYMVSTPTSTDDPREVRARIFNLKSSTSMRNLNPSDVERMVSLKGMIIRSSSIIPEIREAIFRCLVCGYYSDPVVINRGQITEPKISLKEE